MSRLRLYRYLYHDLEQMFVHEWRAKGCTAYLWHYRHFMVLAMYAFYFGLHPLVAIACPRCSRLDPVVVSFDLMGMNKLLGMTFGYILLFFAIIEWLLCSTTHRPYLFWLVIKDLIYRLEGQYIIAKNVATVAEVAKGRSIYSQLVDDYFDADAIDKVAARFRSEVHPNFDCSILRRCLVRINVLELSIFIFHLVYSMLAGSAVLVLLWQQTTYYLSIGWPSMLPVVMVLDCLAYLAFYNGFRIAILMSVISYGAFVILKQQLQLQHHKLKRQVRRRRCPSLLHCFKRFQRELVFFVATMINVNRNLGALMLNLLILFNMPSNVVLINMLAWFHLPYTAFVTALIPVIAQVLGIGLICISVSSLSKAIHCPASLMPPLQLCFQRSTRVKLMAMRVHEMIGSNKQIAITLGPVKMTNKILVELVLLYISFNLQFYQLINNY